MQEKTLKHLTLIHQLTTTNMTTPKENKGILKKIIAFLFDYTMIGWAVTIIMFVIFASILIAPYADIIRLFMFENMYEILAFIVAIYYIYYAYIWTKNQWIEFNKSYKK